MPSTMTSDQMGPRTPVVIDLDAPPRAEEAPAAKPATKAKARQKPPPKPTSARAAAGPPKDVKPAKTGHKESVPVRVKKDDTDVYSIWNCPESPGERIRVSDERVLKFRMGTLKCKTAGDDEAVALANEHAGGRYIRADEDMIDHPIVSRLTEPPTYWYSHEAHRRHQEQYKRDHA